MAACAPVRQLNPFARPAKKLKVEHATLKLWDVNVNRWYPNLLERPFFAPTQHVNRVHHEQEQIFGENVSIAHPPVPDLPKNVSKALQQSDVRDDQTQQRVLYCLETLAEQDKTGMMVISGLQFTDYLVDAPPPPKCTLPKPYGRGDFDIVILHLRYGIFVSEIKAVGDILDTLPTTEAKKEKIVCKKLRQGIGQLEKAEQMLQHLVSDLQNPPRIKKILMMPNISRNRLRECVEGCPQAKKELSQCFQTRHTSDPLNVCLCADELSDIKSPFDVTDEVLKNLSVWWKHTVEGSGPDPCMTDELYRDLVRRFAGPATKQKFDLHTAGEAISFTGDNFAKVVFTEEQKKLLDSAEPLVFVTGPPGTGKTLVLTLKGKHWSCSVNGVHLLSTWSCSLAACRLIKHEIEEMNRKAGNKKYAVYFHRFNLTEDGQLEEAVETLVAAAGQSGDLRVIVDEAYAGGSEFETLCKRLLEKIPKLYIWGASIYHRYTPCCLKEETFSEPLRTPPTVTFHVEQSGIIQGGFVGKYKERSSPPPTCGPRPCRVKHEGPRHTRCCPANCEECGAKLAEKLKKIGVGETEPAASTRTPPVSGLGAAPTASSATQAQGSEHTKPKPLRFSDVFVLTITTSYDGLKDEQVDELGIVERPASGMVIGLRAAGIPVRIVAQNDDKALDDVVKKTGPDAVIAADADTIRGLERKIVVWVEADRNGQSPDEVDFGKLDAMSRTNAQLIVVS